MSVKPLHSCHMTLPTHESTTLYWVEANHRYCLRTRRTQYRIATQRGFSYLFFVIKHIWYLKDIHTILSEYPCCIHLLRLTTWYILSTSYYKISIRVLWYFNRITIFMEYSWCKILNSFKKSHQLHELSVFIHLYKWLNWPQCQKLNASFSYMKSIWGNWHWAPICLDEALPLWFKIIMDAKRLGYIAFEHQLFLFINNKLC